MRYPSEKAFKTILGPNLQGGALRAVIILGAFAFVGASLAWLAH